MLKTSVAIEFPEATLRIEFQVTIFVSVLSSDDYGTPSQTSFIRIRTNHIALVNDLAISKGNF